MSRYKSSYILFIFTLFLFYFANTPACLAGPSAKELNKKATIAIKTGSYQEALTLLNQAMKLAPNWGEPYYNAAQLLRLKNKQPRMLKALAKAWELEPKVDKYSDAYANALNVELIKAKKTNNRSEVNRLRKLILKVDPSDVKTGISIISDLLRQKKLGKAKEISLNLLKKNGKLRTKFNSEPMGQLFYILAKLELKSNNLSQAKTYADNANKFSFSDPSLPKSLLKKIKKQQSDKVRSLLQSANEKNNNGDKTGAIMLLKTAQRIAPYDENIEKELARIGDAKEAAGALNDAKRLIKENSWLEATELLLYVVDADSTNVEAKKLCKKGIAIRKRLLKKIGQANAPEDIDGWRNLILKHYSLGKTMKSAGNLKGAKERFNNALAIIKLHYQMLPLKADIDKDMKDIQAVDHQRDLYDKGVEARNNNEFEECIKYLTQLPKDYEIQLPSYLAHAYWKTDDQENALKMSRYQLINQPENNRAKYIIGCIFLERGQKDRAYKYFKEIYDADPDFPEITDKLAISAAASKGKIYIPIALFFVLLWMAYSVYKWIPEYNKNSAIKRAAKALKQKQLDECIEELIKIRRLPILTEYDGARISVILAQAYLGKGRYDVAIGECKHLISINPKDEKAHSWLGKAYLGRRVVGPDTLPELLNLYKNEPQNKALVSLLGEHYTKQKKLTNDGVKILEKWLELEPTNPGVLKPLGRFYLSSGRTDEMAMNVFQRMMELGATEPDFLMGVAKIKLKQRKFDECLKLCEEVLGADVNNELVHLILKDAYHKQSKLPELIDIYKNFLETNPYNVAFQNGFKAAQALLDKIPAAQVTESGIQTNQEIICPHCEATNPVGEYYCQSCGKNLA